MRCPRFTHFARTINTRICFSQKFNKLGIIKDNINEIIVLPNFPVENGKIIHKKFLPKKNLEIKFIKGQDDPIIKNLSSYDFNSEEIPNNEEFSNALNSTGQLIIINIFTNRNFGLEFDSLSGTFSIVDFIKDIKILTALHNIQVSENSKTLKIYNFSETDMLKIIDGLFQKF